MVSSAVGYAAAALGHLAVRGDGPVRVLELAEATGAPAAYLSKIIHLLARKGLLETTKGKGGGVVLRIDPRTTTLYDLCVALDDEILHPKCALGTADCSDDRACPAHDLQKEIRERQFAFLKSTTIQDVGEFAAGRKAASRTESHSASRRSEP